MTVYVLMAYGYDSGRLVGVYAKREDAVKKGKQLQAKNEWFMNLSKTEQYKHVYPEYFFEHTFDAKRMKVQI